MSKRKVFEIRPFPQFPPQRVMVNVEKYYSTNTLAIELVCVPSEDTPYEEPYAVITVNLDGTTYGNSQHQSDVRAFVDTNNYPWAEEFLTRNGLAKACEIYGRSGFCTYPLYEFNLEAFYE